MSLSVGGRLLLLGAGKMGGAMLEGWLRLGLDPAHVAAIDPQAGPAVAARLAERGVALNPDPAALGAPAVLVLAVKPQVAAAALAPLAGVAGPATLVVSIMAGTTVATIAGLLPRAGAVVRAMPNTPAAVGRGVTAAFAGPGVSPAQRAAADALLRAVGVVEWIGEEALIDAVTAVSGSGPAYVFHLVEALAQAGEAAGLPADLAMTLARETVVGSGELLRQSPDSAAQLRVNVTSPGGTTAAALAVLTGEGGLAPLLARAVLAARDRARDLAG